MSLHLVRIGVNLPALAMFAAQRRLDDEDYGYALHALLAARFGPEVGPRPFRFLPEHAGGPHLLGYVEDWPTLSDAARLPALEPLVAGAFTGPPAAQPMPAPWRSAARYGFEVRVRPVVRFGRTVRAQRAGDPGAPHPDAGEIDAHVAARRRAEHAGDDPATVDRVATYVAWLSKRLGGAAMLEEAGLRAFRRSRVRRGTHAATGARMRVIDGPDAVIGGTLVVADPDAFAALLARGVGRHAAFGFGMMLLSPPGRAG